MFNNPYEVLAYLSKQCNLFEPIKQEFERISEENTEMKEQVNVLGQELAKSKVENIKKDNIINTLGQELAQVKIQLAGGNK